MAGRTVWYPGHMASGERELSKLIDKLDLIVEVRDARAPALTSSPVIKRLSKLRPVAVVLSKKDLASEDGTAAWLRYFESAGKGVLTQNKKGALAPAGKGALAPNAWAFDMRNARLGAMLNTVAKLRPAHRELRLAVVGIPNVGKSFFLNLLVGRNAAQVGGIPGITRGVSWYKGNGFLAVDSPGILDPHGGDDAQRRLACLGCAKTEVIGGFEIMGAYLVDYLRRTGLLNMIGDKWDIGDLTCDAQEILRRIGTRLGCLVAGGNVNLELAGRRLVESFAAGKLGRVTLEYPGDDDNGGD